MNKSLRWKLILAFVLIFLAGAACGFFGAVHIHRVFFAHMAPDSMAQHMKERMRVELRLSPEQMQKISPIIDHAASQLKTTRDQTMRSVHEILSQTHHEMQPLLTPEQRIKLEEMEKRHRRLLHRHGFIPLGPPPSPSPSPSPSSD
jgi:Spy/CpxP family protein refolding chaperone